ncbi:hypothetical protein AVEN_201530-1 [Araneus ventricosus]|uniref:DUF5641 domain-containing protein n=1 Tax=Araneus ventricosus TaxID=182803 RepID=A0A4Y2W2S9_ARAVE|nr:hypothetical protein AVEN_201530-1 [Araneus ventricosus]
MMDLRNAHALKNPNPQRNIAIDDVVLIEGDNKSKLLWRLGRAIQVFPGRDGGVRSCLLKTSCITEHPPPVFVSEDMGRNGRGLSKSLLTSANAARGTDLASSGRPRSNPELL